MMMLCTPPPFSSLASLSLTHTDMHMLLMGFHNKWLLIPEPDGRKSMLPDLLSFLYSGALRQKKNNNNHTTHQLPIY